MPLRGGPYGAARAKHAAEKITLKPLWSDCNGLCSCVGAIRPYFVGLSIPAGPQAAPRRWIAWERDHGRCGNCSDRIYRPDGPCRRIGRVHFTRARAAPGEVFFEALSDLLTSAICGRAVRLFAVHSVQLHQPASHRVRVWRKWWPALAPICKGRREICRSPAPPRNFYAESRVCFFCHIRRQPIAQKARRIVNLRPENVPRKRLLQTRR